MQIQVFFFLTQIIVLELKVTLCATFSSKTIIKTPLSINIFLFSSDFFDDALI